MLLLLVAFAAGGLLLAASLTVLPYRARFARRQDRAAFMVSTLSSGLLGGGMAAGSGTLFLMGLA